MDILNDILAATSVALDTLYPEIPVFTELVPNQLPEQCFLLGFAGELRLAHALGSRYELGGKLDIAYLAPKKVDNFRQELNMVFTRISLNLRHLRFGEVRLRLQDHRRQDVDDVMHSICAFSTCIYARNLTPRIRSLLAIPEVNSDRKD